jgi:hypothetical protein
MTHDGITNGMRVALLATVALWAAPGHADWRKTGMTTGDHRKDALSDLKDLRTKRPNEPPPTQAGKLEGGVKIEHEPGSIVYRVDMYPNYTARIQLEKWYKDVFVPKPEIADVLPLPNCKRPLISNKVPPVEETTGQTAKNEEGCNALIIQANTPGNPNGAQTTDNGNGNGAQQAPFTPSGGGTVAGTGGSAVATGSMTNILALDSEGQVVAILMINTMPSWQRYDEGKVEIHNRSFPFPSKSGGGGDNSSGGLAAFVNFQCAPTCRRVRDPAENALQGNRVPGVGTSGTSITNTNSN